MGYTVHSAIVVTGHDHPPRVASEYPMAVSAAHARAVELCLDPSPIHESAVNDWRSFFVPPSGSKSGWDNDVDHQLATDSFVVFLRSLAHADGSSAVQWVEVTYGGDEPGRNTAIFRAHGLTRNGGRRA